MYKTRGRADDPRNVAELAKNKSLADVVLVDKLESRKMVTYTPIDETCKGTHHFQKNHKTNNAKTSSAGASMLGSTKVYKINLPNCENNQHPRFENMIGNDPLVSRKKVFNKEQKGKKPQSSDIVKKLKNMEGTNISPKGANETVVFNLQKELELTQNQINLATAQLAEIQKLLSIKQNVANNDMPTGIKDEEVTRETLIKTQVKPEKKKVYSTLTEINKKLEKMQTKYFSEPRVEYKNFRDRLSHIFAKDSDDDKLKYEEFIGAEKIASETFNTTRISSKITIKTRKQSKNLETIYENDAYNDESADNMTSNMKLNDHCSTSKLVVEYDNVSNRKKSKQDNPASCKGKLYTKDDIIGTSKLYSQNHGYNAAEINDVTSRQKSIDILYSPRHDNGDSYEIDVGDHCQVLKLNEDKQIGMYNEDDGNKIADIFGWKHTILKSDYLMKELKVNNKELTIDIAKAINKDKNKDFQKKVSFLTPRMQEYDNQNYSNKDLKQRVFESHLEKTIYTYDIV